jgi:hypothetical protein
MCSHNFGQNLEHFTEKISFQKRSFWNWGNEEQSRRFWLFVGVFGQILAG